MNQQPFVRPVFLCGMMGAGKSTIGKKLAEELNVPFMDLDDLIEKSEGMSIPEIFNQKGEKTFRKIERKQTINIAGNAKGIISLGGGTLQNQQIVDHLKIHGWLIFIDTPKKKILQRLQHSEGRPMLESDKEISNRINSLFDERMKYYEQAHFTVKTDEKSVDETITEIIKRLQIYEGRNYR